MLTTPSLVALVIVALSAPLVAGCQAAPAESAATGTLAPEYDKSTGRLTKIAYDANRNGTHDTWAFMDGARLIRLEADENENGRIDRWEYYPADAGTVRVPPERIERATADDGRVTRKEFFAGTEMVRVEEDTDANGVVDKWETYTKGTLSMLALDTSGDGKPDRRLVYTPDGALDRIEVDPTGSGQFRRLEP